LVEGGFFAVEEGEEASVVEEEDQVVLGVEAEEDQVALVVEAEEG
jgi:hypothetical protein